MAKKKIYKTNKPYFGSGVLCDNLKGDSPKPDCLGVFTHFLSWAFPSTRSCYLVFTIYNLPKINIELKISIRKSDTEGEPQDITSPILNIKEANSSLVASVHLNYQFNGEGNYEFICSFKEFPNKLTIPFIVNLQKWPVFTKKEIDIVHSTKKIPKSIRADVNCDKCKHAYIFEEVYDTESPVIGGINRFPEAGYFECNQCKNIIHTKDLQGQLRSILKNNIKLYGRGI